MKSIKRFAALAIVLVCIGAASLLLMFDYDTTTTKLAALTSSVVFFAAGIGLGYLFNRHNLLPE
jgi:cell division protein FtsW (lipid II flippase)